MGASSQAGPSLAFARGGRDASAICNLDEDEATLAVAAARAALAEAGAAPETVTGIRFEGSVDPGLAATLVHALGLRAARVGEAGQATPPHSAQGLVLEIAVRAVRATTAPSPGESFARARLLGAAPDAGRAARGAAAAVPGRIVSPEILEKLVKAEATALRSVPMGANIPRATWDASLEARYRLLGSVCDHCKRGHHPPINPCPVCGRHTRAESFLRPGTLHTWTTVAAGAGPTEFDPWQEVWGEYGVAVVEYEHGVRVAGMIVDTDLRGLNVGATMEPVFRRLYAQEGAWRYGTKFRALA